MTMKKGDGVAANDTNAAKLTPEMLFFSNLLLFFHLCSLFSTLFWNQRVLVGFRILGSDM